jgi:hypothetical protein
MWLTDSGLTALLAFIVVTVFIIEPVRALGSIGHFVVAVMFSFVLVSGTVAVAQSRLAGVIAGGVVLGSLVVHWLTFVRGGTALEVADSLVTLVSLGLFAVLIILQVFREGPITMQRIQGAIAVYLLIGMMWTFAYKVVALAQPTAFAGLKTDVDSEHLSGQLLYFSFVTLTTLGYGDITAADAVPRSLAIVEALIGQLYPAILIARLVSMELLYRQARSADKHASQPVRRDAGESTGERRPGEGGGTARHEERGRS